MDTVEYISTKTIKQMLSRSAHLFGGEVAFYLRDGGQVTYKQLYDDVEALGTALLSEKKQKHIGIIGKNSREWATTYLAVINGAGVVVPLDKELSPQELVDSIDRANIDVIFYSDDVKDAIIQTKSKNDTVRFVAMSPSDNSDDAFVQLMRKGRAMIEQGDRRYSKIVINKDSMAALLFTSGTTSQSKIVMLSHYNIMFDLINGSVVYNVTHRDKFLSILPMHHMFECNAGFLVPLYHGASIYFSQGVRYIGNEFKEQKPSIVICVPRILDALSAKIKKGIDAQGKTRQVRYLIRIAAIIDKVLPGVRRRVFAKIHNEFGGNIRMFLSGAADINKKTLATMTDLGFAVFQGYGLTECAPAITLSHFKNNDPDSVGPPIRGTEVCIDQPDVEGNGEILVKGPHVMLGYYNDRRRTKEACKDGYLRTGDIGYIKHNGSLKIVGRLKNVIVTAGGKKIYPEEIEALLLDCPAIKDVVIHGVAHGQGMQICATIVLCDDGEQGRWTELEKEARNCVDIVNQTLAQYERINTIKLRRSDFEKTSTLKIKRHLVGDG